MEHRYESDMTKKDRRQQEIEKLKSLNFTGKLEYIWMYYKVWFAAAAGIIVLLYLGVSMYQGSRENVLVNVVVVGGDAQDTEKIEKLEQEIKGALGAEGKYDVVRVQANIPLDGGAQTSQTALTTLFGADAVDVLICPENIYQEYARQDGFLEEPLVIENQGRITEVIQVPYTDIYAAVPVNAQHKEAAEKVMEYLSEY